MKNIKCQACSVFPLHVMYVQEGPLERVLWNESVLLFLNIVRVCAEAFNFSGQLWCFLSSRGKQIPLAVPHPAASGTSSTSGACSHGLLFGLGAVLRKGLDKDPCLPQDPFEFHHPRRAPRDARPRLPKRAQGSPYRQQWSPDVFHSLRCSHSLILPRD